MDKHIPCPSQEGNLGSPLLEGDLGVGKKSLGFCLLKPNLIHPERQLPQKYACS